MKLVVCNDRMVRTIAFRVWDGHMWEGTLFLHEPSDLDTETSLCSGDPKPEGQCLFVKIIMNLQSDVLILGLSSFFFFFVSESPIINGLKILH